MDDMQIKSDAMLNNLNQRYITLSNDYTVLVGEYAVAQAKLKEFEEKKEPVKEKALKK